MERLETVSVVWTVVGKEDASLTVQHHEFGGRGTGINADIDLVALHLVPAHTLHEEVLLLGFPFLKMLFVCE